MNTIQRFLKTSAIYFIGNVLSKIISFFLLPIYTAYIIPAQFGQYDLVIAFINLAVPIAFFQIWDGMFRFAFEKSSQENQYNIISNSYIISILGIFIFILIFFIIYIFSPFQYFLESTVYGVLFGYQYFFSFSARIFLRNKLFVSSGIVNTLITFILNIILIVVFNFDIRSLYIASATGCLAQIIIIESRLHIMRNISLRLFKKKLCIQMLKFSIPLCIATISYWLLNGFTKLCITEKLGAFENGQYAVALKFASTITILVNVFQFAWNEIAYLMSNDSNRNYKYEISINLLSKTVIVGSAVMCILIKWIFPYFIAKDYSFSYFLIPISIIGVAFNTIAGFIGTYFMMEKKTIHILSTTMFASFVNCFFCIFSIKCLGILGPTCILALSFFILMVLRLMILSVRYNIRYHISNMVAFIVLGLSVYDYYVVKNYYIDILVILLSIVGFVSIVQKYLLMLINKTEFK